MCTYNMLKYKEMLLLEGDMEGGLNQPIVHHVLIKLKRRIKKLCPCGTPDIPGTGLYLVKGAEILIELLMGFVSTKFNSSTTKTLR